MRLRTAEAHRAAERSGIVAALLRGQASRTGYALYLRNLLPAYQAMEQILRLHPGRPDLDGLAHPSLYRADSIIADLQDLAGPGWATGLKLLPAGARYAARVAWAGQGTLLIAHCYTRYLGDLNGGRLLTQCLVRQFGPDFRALAFNSFRNIPAVVDFAATYRHAIDALGQRLTDVDAAVEEAAVAFELNKQVSIEVDAVFKSN